MNYLTVEQVIELNRCLINRYGGILGIRDQNLLESAIASPMTTIYQQEMYPSPLEKAACYLFSICKNHPFLDGNKRTASACCILFLIKNGIELEFDQKEFEDFVCYLADSKIGRESVVAFLREKCLVHERNTL